MYAGGGTRGLSMASSATGGAGEGASEGEAFVVAYVTVPNQEVGE